MGLSLLLFFGSVTTVRVCCCVGGCACASVSWYGLSSALTASGGAVRSSCAVTASGPQALSGRCLSTQVKCPMVSGSSCCACCLACSCRLGRSCGWSSCLIVQRCPQSCNLLVILSSGGRFRYGRSQSLLRRLRKSPLSPLAWPCCNHSLYWR